MKVSPVMVATPALPAGLLKVTCQTGTPWLVVLIVASLVSEGMAVDSLEATADIVRSKTVGHATRMWYGDILQERRR